MRRTRHLSSSNTRPLYFISCYLPALHLFRRKDKMQGVVVYESWVFLDLRGKKCHLVTVARFVSLTPHAPKCRPAQTL